ncbi:beta-ketoacyl-ACP synthase III [Streptomyces fulvorobeus]|uniref:Beta-ketoacyl-[acyl-carrier-protein] synthase III n=1 Tax=Streptomyces fulvorobeus TaxID=284028 RepID=A0A7J0C0R9_9ACTN|nr:beta-ketoacyl-ACP synthase III [Streptomyces fulvorobeus]NYE39831.1 3-oxoacyl-[acyl-carrier-protein] synthase-3 [Streptomyces fulvorobeus]GFM96082.1 3-oxoacyl-[acyl-carrier-protein] synthase 3 protein 3 [Streptomyces fulvorobeus]
MSAGAAVLCGLGTWLPPNAVTNDDLARELDTSDEWIRSRTGIGTRYVADPSTATSDLAVEAGRRALKSAGTESVDAVVLATTTPDRLCPATAPLVAAQLGLGTVAAFDVGAVCTGFLYALAAGAGLIAAGTSDSVLVIGADMYSGILDPADRSTRAIFGDGAGAVVLRSGDAGEPGALGRPVLGSDGTGSDLISVRSGGSREPLRAHTADEADPYFRMAGKAVFRNAVERMAEVSLTAAQRAGWEIGDIDRLIAHQANLRILHATADRMRLPRHRCPVHLDRVGNTAAASIPLALSHAVTTGELLPGHRTVLTAFGGGLTWGACTLRWPALTPA